MLKLQHLTKRFGAMPLFTDLCMELDAHNARKSAVRRFCPPESRAAGRASAAISMPSC